MTPPDHPAAASPPDPTTTFATFVIEHRRGNLNDELSRALAAVTAAAQEHGKAGKITMSITVKPEGDGLVSIADTVKVTVPEGKRGAGLWYADEDGNVSRHDPRQLTVRDELHRRRTEGAEEATA